MFNLVVRSSSTRKLSAPLHHSNADLTLQAAEGGGSSYVGSGAPDPKAHTPGTRPDGHKLLANMKKLLHGDPSW